MPGLCCQGGGIRNGSERTRSIAMSSDLPTLWHIPVSHYNEKVRWALAHKGIEHERRAPPPGGHIAFALWLTRGAHDHLSGADDRRPPHRRLDRDHRRARAALPRARPLPGRPRTAAARPRARGLLRRGARAAHRGCSPGTSCSRTAIASALSSNRPCPPRLKRVGGLGDLLCGRLHQAPLRASPTKRRPSGRGRRSSPRSTASTPSWRRAAATTWSAIVHGRRPHRRLALLPGRPPGGGPTGRRHRPRRHGSLPRPAEGAPRLPMGRRDVPAPPQPARAA